MPTYGAKSPKAEKPFWYMEAGGVDRTPTAVFATEEDWAADNARSLFVNVTEVVRGGGNIDQKDVISPLSRGQDSARAHALVRPRRTTRAAS